MASKLALVVRTDLAMVKGKIAAQVAHAAVTAVLATIGRAAIRLTRRCQKRNHLVTLSSWTT